MHVGLPKGQALAKSAGIDNDYPLVAIGAARVVRVRSSPTGNSAAGGIA